MAARVSRPKRSQPRVPPLGSVAPSRRETEKHNTIITTTTGMGAAAEEKWWRPSAVAGKLVFPFTTVATHLPAHRRRRRRRSPIPASL